MRKHLLLPVFLLLGCSAFGQKETATTVTYDLAEALSKKLVSLDIRSMGGHQGECLKIVCRNLRGRSLRLRVAQGQLLEPIDSSQQTLVVAEARDWAVSARDPAEVVLRTFCTQAGDFSPTGGSSFALGVLAAENLRRLLQFLLEKNKSGSDDAQNAVWCLTNGHALGSIGDPELVKFTADLLGKQPPGYTIKYHTAPPQPGERAELGKALVVEGNYRFTLERAEKLSLRLYDAAGRLIKVLRKDELMQAGDYRSGLHLEVYNLQPGRYFVRLEKKNQVLVKEIEVEF